MGFHLEQFCIGLDSMLLYKPHQYNACEVLCTHRNVAQIQVVVCTELRGLQNDRLLSQEAYNLKFDKRKVTEEREGQKKMCDFRYSNMAFWRMVQA